MRTKVPFTRLNLFRDQRGVTLIELLASIFIFLAILIPLTTVYVKGVEIYHETTLKNQLLNETDFVVGDVMRSIQEASYFDLAPADSDTVSEDYHKRDQLRQIIEHPHVGLTVPAMKQVSTGMMLYKRELRYDSKSGSTRSILTRETRYFQNPSNASTVFNLFPRHQTSFYTDGLFVIPDDRRVILYLIMALPEDAQHRPLNSPAAILASLDASEENREYIRVIRTEIDVSNIREGW